MVPDESKNRRLIPVTEWRKYHPWPSVAGLRHLIFHERSNGFSVCVRRVGKRVLIDEEEFFRWVDCGDRQAGETRPKSPRLPHRHSSIKQDQEALPPQQLALPKF